MCLVLLTNTHIKKKTTHGKTCFYELQGRLTFKALGIYVYLVDSRGRNKMPQAGGLSFPSPGGWKSEVTVQHG